MERYRKFLRRKFVIKNISKLPLVGIAFLITSCGQETAKNSQLGDIFSADNNPERRHKATKEELLWTVNVGGCSGSIIAPEYLLTADHCRPRPNRSYQSGSSIANNSGKDITSVEIVESNRRFDYSIVKIKWKNGKKPSDQKIPKLILTKSDGVKVSVNEGEGDEIFSVGFPVDKNSWGATFAKGRLKSFSGTNIKYNMGIINGNSGGAAWRTSDNMLVSLTNNGPHMHGEPGWDNNDINDSRAWNWGANMGQIYQQSKILKEIFPNGVNKYYVD